MYWRCAKKKCTCQVYQPIDYKIAEDTVVQPDLLILCKQPKEAYLDFPPTLVVEILSPSAARKDRITKYELYEQEKIPYYLIVDADKRQVEIYVLNKEAKYEVTLQENEFQFELDNTCCVNILLHNIWG